MLPGCNMLLEAGLRLMDKRGNATSDSHVLEGDPVFAGPFTLPFQCGNYAAKTSPRCLCQSYR